MEILKTKTNKPPRILIHASHGVGKSSLAAAAPDPLFINVEGGLENIDTSALPMCHDFDTVMVQLSEVYAQEHDYKTLVIDSIDWVETLIQKHVCKEGGKDSISDFCYGAGFQSVLENFGRVVNALTALREERNMAVILIAHSHVKTYENPLGQNYDMHTIKLREKNAELFLEWADLVGFLHFSTFTTKKEEGFKKTTKVTGGTDRVLSCSPSAAYVSKNRYGIKTDISIPDPLTGWNNLITAIKGA